MSPASQTTTNHHRLLRGIVAMSLRQRGILVVLTGLFLLYGGFIATRIKVDVFPEFAPPQAVVQTEAPGLSAEQVELWVTRVIEQALGGLADLASLRSESIQGLSVVTTVFSEHADIYRARQLLAEKLAEITGALPVGVKPPRLAPLTSSTMDLLKFGLVSERLSPRQLRTFADWVIKPRMLAVPGVARCSVMGGEVQQRQIQANPERMAALGVSLEEVLETARQATGMRGAGFIETRNQRMELQTETGASTPEILGGVLATHQAGQPVRLQDVATIVDGAEPKYGEAVIQGKPGVLLTVSGQFGANTMTVTLTVEKALADLRPLLAAEGITCYDRLHRPASYIDAALGNLKYSLWLGAVLVGVVLLLFIGDWRTAGISFMAVPISLLAAIIVMHHGGATLNTISLGGLAVALGVVVDDAIIDVENILRRLRQNAALPEPRAAYRVIVEASLEVRGAVVYATFLVALVFAPALALTGLQGRFFSPLAVAFILATLASLAVALTITPALCSLVLRRIPAHREPAHIRWLKNGHAFLLARVCRRPGLALAFTLVLLALSLAALPFMGGELLPEFREGHFVLQVSTAPGTSLAEMARLGQRVCHALLADTGHIATVEQQIGRAELGEDPFGPHRCEFHVELKAMPGEEEERMAGRIRQILAGFPGVQFEVLTFLGDRIGETIAGESAEIVIRLFGENLDALDQKAREIAGLLSRIRGAEDIRIKAPPGMPRLILELRQDRLARFGFRPVEVLEVIQTAMQGTVVTQVFDGQRPMDLVVMFPPEGRQNPQALGELPIRNRQGSRVPLRELVNLRPSSGHHSILHDHGQRLQTITCNARGRDVASLAAEIKGAISRQIIFPAGLYPVFSGEAEAAGEASQELLFYSALSGAGMILLLFAMFGRWRPTLLILANIPFALAGGIAVIFFGERILSLGSLVGLVTLFGISARNSIMLMAHFEHLATREGRGWNLETVLQGARERLLPVLMTALATALGLLPMALGAGEAGREIEGPLALVILGGLATSTLLNLLILPALAWRFAPFQAVPQAHLATVEHR